MKLTETIEIVIIGNGMVAHRFCDLIVEHIKVGKYHITIIGEEPYYAYDRVHLTDHFYGKSFHDLQLENKGWYEEREIDVVLRSTVEQIDARDKVIKTSSGKICKYDKLIFATGSMPFIPPIQGIEQVDHVCYYRNFNDLLRIRIAAESSKRAVVIGGGLLGLEAAKALTELNVKTHVVEFAHHLMPKQIDEVASDKLKAVMESMNIHLHCRRQTKSFSMRDDEILIHFNDGDHIVANMVVIAAGVVPRDELARNANIQCDPRGGIIVNDHLETSEKDIFAMGDCAQHHGKAYGLISPGYKMAEVLVEYFENGISKFEEMNHSTRLKLLGVELVSLGQPFQPGDVIRYDKDAVYRRITLRDGNIIGIIAVGEWLDLPELQKRMDLSEGLSRQEIDEFKVNGVLGAFNSGLAGVLHWPDEMVICNCMNITKGVIVKACKEGCKSTSELSAKTGVGTVCGSCKPQLSNFVGMKEDFKEQATGQKLFGSSLIISLIILLIYLIIPSIEYSNSVQSKLYNSLEVLWRDSFYKQLTGYSMLALTVLSLSLSLRKRVRKIMWFDFQYWRSGHILLISLVFVLIPLHTGLRMGNNLNFMLMMSYTITSLTGLLTGWAVWMDSFPQSKFYGFSRKHKRNIIWLHLVCFWPLPSLLAFHILKFYCY